MDDPLGLPLLEGFEAAGLVLGDVEGDDDVVRYKNTERQPLSCRAAVLGPPGRSSGSTLATTWPNLLACNHHGRTPEAEVEPAARCHMHVATNTAY